MVKLTKEEELSRKQGAFLKEVTDLPGWQEVLLPWLRDKINHSWVDPRTVESNEDFVRRYNLAWSMAQSCDQIIGFVTQMIEEGEALAKKEKGEEKSILREAIS